MKLIGMMDSPYVRRVAVSLALYGVEFESLPLSVFSGFDEFSRINPVVKAPTVVLDNGKQLMDSTLILHYFETTNPAGRRLLPTHPEALARDLHLLGVMPPVKKRSSMFMSTVCGRKRSSISRG